MLLKQETIRNVIHTFVLTSICVMEVSACTSISTDTKTSPSPATTVDVTESSNVATLPSSTATSIGDVMTTVTALPTTSIVTGRLILRSTSDNGLYEMAVGELRLLLTLATDDGFVAVSPDGTKIAVDLKPSMPDSSRGWDIQLINLDTGDRLKLIASSTVDYSPTWSPDGQSIAFASTRDSGWNIYRITLNNPVPTNITTNFHKLTNHLRPECLSWSPDGSRIAFDAIADTVSHLTSHLFVMNTDGTGLIALTSSDAEDRCPSWSPDSQRVAFASNRDGNWEIYTMNVDGSNIQRLTNDSASDVAPVWSPDGMNIAFQSDKPGYWSIFVMSTDGSGLSRLIDSPMEFVQPTWLPK